jgi:oligopeptide transport system substrate-binding protein
MQGHGARGKLYYLLLDQWRKAFPGWKFMFDDGRHVQICERKPAQIATSGWLAEYPDPQDFFSNLWITIAFYNFSFISNPEVDALCAQADALQNQAMRISLYQQAEQLLVAQVAAIPLNQAMDVQAVRSHVVGWRGAQSGVTPLLVWQQVYIRR